MPGREEFKREYLESIAETCSKPFAECSRMERYTALAAMIRECCSGVRAETLRRRAAAGEKIVYYFSMEFLVGRLLENYLIQLGIRDMTADILAELGEDLDALLECERDPGLGNGGLGRLAACYLDSLAAEDVPCVGMGLLSRIGSVRGNKPRRLRTSLPLRSFPPAHPLRLPDRGAGRLALGRLPVGDRGAERSRGGPLRRRRGPARGERPHGV